MSELTASIGDSGQRRRALDVTGSFIVQAPAGSGKTELLIQRILALLASAGHPEEILAITFTRKAAAEMHKRLLEALETAASEHVPSLAHAALTRSLARAALDRDRERGWALLDNPSRLQVMTIDGFGAALVRRMPYLARFGEAPAIAEDPAELYRDAAERLLHRLEQGGPGSAAIERLLKHLDNQLPLLRDLLVAMLGRRDQWLRHLDPANLATARPDLEGALRLQIVAALAALRAVIADDLLEEFCTLGRWAAGNLDDDDDGMHPLAALAGRSTLPAAIAEDMPAWLALVHLALTKEGDVRLAVNKNLGFPAGSAVPAGEMKERIKAVFDRLRAEPAVVERLKDLRHLPAAAYTDDQWEVLESLIELLPLADRELRETFRGRGQVDFPEIARGALTALGDELAPGDLLLHLDSRLRHILVDEFQDTARGQFELLTRLTAGWEAGDGRTLFVVGDPMQSIYRFREAEVGLYLRIRSRGLENIRLDPLVLQANFRSQAGLVDWFNAVFSRLFPPEEDEMRGAVAFSAATPVRAADGGEAVRLACFARRDDGAEAECVIDLIRQSRIEDPAGTIAVLVRSRAHLTALVPALKAAGIPWQAQEIDPLTSRPAIRDLLALTRALLHPADRVAWLSLLRAPWCGLRLDDLLALCGSSAKATIWECLTGQERQPQLFSPLSAEGQARLDPVIAVLARALAGKGRVPLRRLIESAWLGLKGPVGLEAGDLDDAGQFFDMIAELDEGGDLVRLEALEERLGALFAAPDPKAGPALQLMTIHKAKGLEFDTVILPGLGRPIRVPERPLLLWHEQLDPASGREGLLLAPIPASAADGQDPTFRAIARIHAEKDKLEMLRLFYVAATRARRRLCLLGHAEFNQDGELAPAAGSLLRVAWPVLAAIAAENLVEPAAVAVVPATRGIMLRRRPAGWVAPELAQTLATVLPGTRRPSAAGHREAASAGLSLQREEGRILGTVVHAWLERLARNGPDQWTEGRLAASRSLLRDELLRGGVPRARVDACVTRAVAALANTLRSDRGRWLLQPHPGAACELGLTGVLAGAPVHAVIDRTFVDEDGVRWVVDYKISSPGDGERLEDFLSAEVGWYRSQLDDYRRLLEMGEPPRVVRTALYFPLLDEWCEVG